MSKQVRYSPKVWERAVRMVFDQKAPTARSTVGGDRIDSSKIGCTSETLRRRVRHVERDSGKRSGLTTSGRERLKALAREDLELRRADEILRKISTFFAHSVSIENPSSGGFHRHTT